MFSGFQSLILIIFTSSETSLDKLIVAKLFKKFPAIYGTRRFMSMFLEVCHWAVCTMNQLNILQIFYL